MNQNETKSTGLKLFVVGESSGDPATWSEYAHRALLIAGSAEEALRLVEFATVAAEVRLDKPGVLCVDESGLIDRL